MCNFSFKNEPYVKNGIYSVVCSVVSGFVTSGKCLDFVYTKIIHQRHHQPNISPYAGKLKSHWGILGSLLGPVIVSVLAICLHQRPSTLHGTTYQWFSGNLLMSRVTWLIIEAHVICLIVSSYL